MKKPIQPEKKLGRGLSALLGDSKIMKETPDSKTKILKAVESIDLDRITAGLYQPRINFDQLELQELANSIKENGLIQPIILRKIGDEDQYEIIAGERRFRAAKLLELDKIPSIIKKINNHEALELAIIENTQRSDLSAIEEANGYQQLINDFSYSQEQVAKRVGKSRSYIANLLRLLNLPKQVQNLLDQKLISTGHARALVNSPNPEELAENIVSEGLTVREIEDMVRDIKIQIAPGNLTPRTPRLDKNNEINNLEGIFSELVGLKTKISYNKLKNKGKVIIQFEELEEIHNLINCFT